ncbi:MAG TPA: hypothetical protein VGF16_07345 [Bryobacteraceae bacterium]|jgi:hypothetical protein
MRRSLLPAFTFLLLGVGVASYAQRQPGSQPQQSQPGANPSQQRSPDSSADRDAAQGERISVTGCLAKGSQANEYTITDSSSHEKYSFPGPAQLDNYVNQTVKLNGSVSSGAKGEKVFRPESISPVSNSCSK